MRHAGDNNFIGAPSFRSNNPYSLFEHYNKYAAEYPSIRAISNEYMQVRPFAIDKNGKQQENNLIINALYHPNQEDSHVAFFEKCAVSTLSHRKTYILVWRREGNTAEPGGEITPNNIGGFTFLEYPAIERRDGRTYYKMGVQEFSDQEVMVLPGGVDPKSLYAGYSPSEASRSWAKLDDYIADYQQGFFENGAVPSGMFRVLASTRKEYDDTVDMLQARHRGAGNNNNITYSHQPIDPTSGKPAEAQIQWIPFSQSNKDIDFKNLFEQVNKRIDTAYGVPAIVKGVDDAATYANAQVAEAGFAKRAVKPLLLRNYTQITHELNRITGGMGVAITFKYDIPIVADEEKVKAETKNIDGEIIRAMVTAGYTLDSIVESFKLSTSYKNLEKGETTTTTIENDKPDVDEGGEVDDAPDPSKIDGVTPINKLTSKKHGSKQKPESAPKKKTKAKKKVKVELSDEDKLEKVGRDYMQAQIDRAVEEYNEDPEAPLNKVKNQVNPDPTKEEIDAFVANMLQILIGILVANGEEQYLSAVPLVAETGFDTSILQGFTLTDTAEGSYEAYLRRVGGTYGEDTAESIRKALLDARDNGLTVKETEDALKKVVDTDEYRIKRLARTELNNSQNIGKLEGMKSLTAETGVDWEKTIDHSGVEPCPLCQSQEGIWHDTETPLWAEGTTITDAEGTIYVNDWQTNEANDYHPNGRGALIFRTKELA